MRSILEEEVTIELQHINVKLLLKESENLKLDSVIPVFHSWIQGQIFDELLLDVADYRHVKDGPGLMLIGHEADYSLDNTDGLLGVRYNRKAPLPGTNLDRLIQATRSALVACQRLESDPRLNGKFHFNGQDVQLIINDRLLAPNTETTRQAVEPDFERFAVKLFGLSGSSHPDESRQGSDEPGGQFSHSRSSTPTVFRGAPLSMSDNKYYVNYSVDMRRLLSATIRSPKSFSTRELLNNLAA